LIINIVSGGRGELAWCPKFFVRDCLKEEFRECHTTPKKKGFRKGELCRLAGTSATKTKQHAMTSFTWVGTKDCEVIFLNDRLLLLLT